MELVKIEGLDVQRLAQGSLIFIEHPEKGVRYVDMSNIFVNTIELSDEDKLKFK